MAYLRVPGNGNEVLEVLCRWGPQELAGGSLLPNFSQLPRSQLATREQTEACVWEGPSQALDVLPTTADSDILTFIRSPLHGQPPCWVPIRLSTPEAGSLLPEFWKNSQSVMASVPTSLPRTGRWPLQLGVISHTDQAISQLWLSLLEYFLCHLGRAISVSFMKGSLPPWWPCSATPSPG